jgi:N-terminal acetyltransferase B complex non-catalytic subunit
MDPLPVTPTWVANYRYHWDIPFRLICREPVPYAFRETMRELLIDQINKPGRAGHTDGKRTDCLSLSEEDSDMLFRCLGAIAAEVYDMHPRFDRTPSIDQAFLSIIKSLDSWYETYRYVLNGQDDGGVLSSRFCSEHDLVCSYGVLEFLVLVARFIPTLRNITSQKSHSLHSKISKSNVEKLSQKTQDCHRIVMTLAQHDIDRTRKTGVQRVRAKVREGHIGKALSAIISDRDVETYAKEYAESAVEAYSGILKVKLN